MRLFDRWREPVPLAWGPPPPGACACEKHLDSLLEVTIPCGAQHGGSSSALTVSRLVETGALKARLADAAETFVDLPHSGQRTGPYHWVLELSDAVRLLYDDDAPVQLDDCLAAQPAVERVAWLDRDRFAVGAPDLCANGVQATLVTALTNSRVRRPG